MNKYFILVIVLFITHIIAFAQGKILVVLSGSDHITLQDGVTHETGFYLSELAVPTKHLLDANYEVVFANPTGKKAVMDKLSDNPQLFSSPEEYHQAKKILELKNFQAPLKLSSLTEEQLQSFDGIFVPGGHAPMEDLCKSADMGKLLLHFHNNNKPTALICHGPIALLSAKDSNGWAYKGYNVTVFSTPEEKYAEQNMLKGKVLFYPSDALTKAGANVTRAEKPWASHVVRDRELITGQNPSSDNRLAQSFLEALAERKNRRELLQFVSNIGQTSKLGTLQFSAIPVDKVTEGFRSNTVYDALAKPINWAEGYSSIYIGSRKKDFPKDKFIARCIKHVNFASGRLSVCGIKGYVVLLTSDYYVSFANWQSQELLVKGGSTKESKQVVADGAEFMDNVFWSDARQIPENYLQNLDGALSKLSSK